MKHLIFSKACYYTLLVALCYSCGWNEQNAVKAFIPGTYERSFEGAFSRGREQLTIDNFSGSTYTILRVVTYQRIDGGKLLPPEQKMEKLTAVYDGRSGTLKETKKGLTISFNSSENSLLIGTAVYKKIK